ncbi:MAG: MFS transporter [Candidatus Heimdallarchaeota archaeon]|nr:MFS transporter [Candidatus Heimdallarchaeota archaeon]
MNEKRRSPNSPPAKDNFTLFWQKFLKYYLILGLLFLVMFTMRATLTMLQIFVPDLSQNFGLSEGRITLVFTIYNISAAGFSLFLGPVTERVGYKISIFLGMFLFGVAMTIIPFAGSFFVLAYAHAQAGLGSALFGPATVAYAGDYFPKKKRTTAIGIIMSAFYVASIIAVPVNSFLSDLIGWRWGVGFMAILCYLVFLLTLSFIPSKSKKPTNQTILDSENALNEPIHHPPKNELKVANQETTTYFDRVKLVLNNKYALGTFFITLFQRGGLFAMMTLLSSWLQGNFGLNKTEVGLIFMGTGTASLISNTLFSWVANKIGKRTVILLGTTLTALWVGIFPFISLTLALAIVGVILLNFFGGMSMGSYNTFITEVDPLNKATTVSINNTFGQMSIAIATALLGGLIYDQTSNYAFTGLAAMGLYIICVILMFIFVRPEKIEDYFKAKKTDKD